jgi:hypothetical protein
MDGMRQRLVTAGLAALSIAVVAGCSSSGSAGPTTSPSINPSPVSSFTYSKVLEGILQLENKAQHHVALAFRAKTVAGMRSQLLAFSDVQAQAVTVLGGGTPPTKAQSANAALKKAFNDNVTVIRALVARIATAKTVSQAVQIIRADSDVLRVRTEINNALAALQALGFTNEGTPTPQPSA